MTNMVITASQSRTTCPDNPMNMGVECNPNKNGCVRGTQTSSGVFTGNCVKADFPFNHSFQYNNGYACEIEACIFMLLIHDNGIRFVK